MFALLTNSPIKLSLARQYRRARICAGTGSQNHVKPLPLEGCNYLICNYDLLACRGILRPRHPKRVLARNMIESKLARLVGPCPIGNLVVSNQCDLHVHHWATNGIYDVTLNTAQTLR